ncbi:MAG: hypothetical protein IKW71_02730 [Elusimicrobiaceae bacterium]|nr:hypothetical protein [Elusimicrobiaceae bacterium]
MKRYILLLISFSFIFAPYCFGQTGRAVARLASRTTLKPLNPNAFRTPLSSQLARQSFAQLLRSGEVAALSKPEQILLLTHKYVEENKQLPRTAISSDNQVVLSRNYSLPEKIETDLGNQFRRLLEDKNTPAEILQEARQLQADFSTKYQSIRIVNNLNKWLMTHDTWPRDQIKPEGRPLTEEEEYEIALARSMNNLLSRTSQNVVPDELLEQIALTRAFYDARYAPVEQEPQAFPNYDMDPPIEYENPAPSRPADFYISASLPRNPVTGRQEVLPTPTPEASVPFPTESIKPLIDHLINWLDTHEKWPSKPQKSFSKYTIKDIEEELLAEDVWRLQKQNPGLVDFVYSIW